MGGGSSSSFYSRKITVNDTDDNCDKIHFTTILQNTQSNITNYKDGDVLIVKLDDTNRIFVEGEHGVCGYITAISASQLIRCLKKGKQFIAIILEVSVMKCKVEITPN